MKPYITRLRNRHYTISLVDLSHIEPEIKEKPSPTRLRLRPIRLKISLSPITLKAGLELCNFEGCDRERMSIRKLYCRQHNEQKRKYGVMFPIGKWTKRT